MNDVLRIDLDGTPDTVYRPGDTVTGHVEWMLEKAPDALELRLFWYSQGRGSRDVGLVGTTRIASPNGSGSQSFELVLPTGPYSFSGRLISLTWALELVSDPSGLSERVEIVMSPGDGEVRLGRAASS